MEILKKICDYMMGGKLVCLGGDQCAIGHVAGFETVDDKSFPDTIDNDFSINMLLAPNDLGLFAQGGSRSDNYDLAANDGSPDNGLQGYLIREQPGRPEPREGPVDDTWPWPKYAGTFVTFPDRGYITYNPFEGSRGIPYDVPVLHCEIEGDRAAYVCAVVSAWSPISDTICEFNPLGIPIGKLACTILSILLAPLFAAAIASAWAAGSDDNRDFDGAGTLSPGDCVVITGRWAYDAGHHGQNELHAVKSVQKIDDPDVCDWGSFQELSDRWCRHVSDAPPTPGPDGHKPAGMSAEQDEVYDSQTQPWNRWVFHPLLDACAPEEEPEQPEEPPVIK